MKQCQEVVRQIKEQHHRTQWINLHSLSPDSLLTVLTNINGNLALTGLVLKNTSIDSRCINELIQVLTNNNVTSLHLVSSPLLSHDYHMIASALSTNTTLKSLRLSNDNNITDKDIPHICYLISVNTKLKNICLDYCPNITKFGIQQVSAVLHKNKRLIKLSINGNIFR